MKNKDCEYGRQTLPYEKFLQKGAAALTDAELLAIIIRTGTKDFDAVSLGTQVLNLNGTDVGLLSLHHLSVKDLMSVKGIGAVKAVKIKCIAELSNRIATARAFKKVCFTSPHTVADYYMEPLRHLEKEHCFAIFLDNRNRLIEDTCISVGTTNASLLSSRELFRHALQVNSVYFMLLHNHPSGDATPSHSDVLLTEKMKEASVLMDIPLLDHIIIGDGCYTSFKEEGII